MKRVLILTLAVIMTLLMCSCGEENTSDFDVPEKPVFVQVGENGSRTDDPVGFQLLNPQIGEKIAVFETNMGDIYIRLFPDSAPITVTNFVALIESGYYDGINFHRASNNFVIQGGDPEGTGGGGDSIWKADFEDEFNANLLNIRGSLSMANAGPATNGSQFFINQNPQSVSKEDIDYDTVYERYYSGTKTQLTKMYNEQVEQYGKAITDVYPDVESFIKAYLRDYIGSVMPLSDVIPEEVWELYKQNGGNINLDGAWRTSGGHAVFGQVFRGMDVVDAIAALDNGNEKPTKTVTIKKAYTTEFVASMVES